MSTAAIARCTAVIAVLALVMVACRSDGAATKEKYDRLALGMSYGEVKGVMGGPGELKRFPNQPEREETYYWYGTDRANSIFVTIVDGRVAAVGTNVPDWAGR
jgi:hypothetical protein